MAEPFAPHPADDVAQLTEKRDRFRRFLALDPDNASLVRDLLDLELATNEVGTAARLADDYLDRHPEDCAIRLRKGRALLMSGHLDEGIAELESVARESDMADDSVVLPLVEAYARAGRWEAVPAALAPEATDYSGLDSTRMKWVMLAHYHNGDGEVALALAELLVRRNPDCPEFLGWLALIWLDFEDYEKAQSLAERTLVLDPANREALLAKAGAELGVFAYESAEAAYIDVCRAHPASGRAWAGLGLVQMQRLALDEAIPSLEKATAHMPQHIGTWLANAWCHIAKRDLDAAKAATEAALKIDARFAESQGTLAVLEVLSGRERQAQRRIKMALRLDRHCFAGRFAEALLEGRTNRHNADEMIRAIWNAPVSAAGGESLLSFFARSQSGVQRKH